jgi:hypothetical protein
MSQGSICRRGNKMAKNKRFTRLPMPALPKFKTFRTKDLDIYCSTDAYFEWLDGMAEENIPSIIGPKLDEALEENEGFRELIDLNADLHKLPKRMAILNAHGESERGNWVYFTDNVPHSTQEWINRHQHNYSLLYLVCCNPGKHEITTDGAAVIAANGTYSDDIFRKDEIQKEIYLLDFGRVDSYCIENTIKQLKTRLDKREARQNG